MQGLLDMGVCPETLPGHQDYAAARGTFEKAWGVTLPQGGRDALGILEGIEKGKIRFLYLAGTNPLVSFPESGRWRKALEKVEFLVVQDILASTLTALAHVVLPGAAPTEKSGSVTSLDHRVNCLARATAPPGEAREDWEILAELYRRVTTKDRPLFVDALLAEIKDLVPIYSDVCFPGEGRCRPCLKEPYLPEAHTLRYTPVDQPPLPAPGLQLVSGKILFHFGTTSTGAEGPLAVAPAGYVEMHPADAAACGVQAEGRVHIVSATGSTQAPVRLNDRLPQGLLFAPYHFADVNIQQIIPANSNRVSVQVNRA
jgi:formate dehydrogenase alpha subunit